MNKRYQTNEIDTSMLAVPGQVSVAIDEIAADMREGLLALAVGAGLQVMAQLMETDVTAVCGPRGKHDPDRAATRHGTEAGSVTLGGRRVPVRRPRVRSTEGAGEVPVPAYELFNSTELLGKMAMEKMLAGLSTRQYPVGLEPVGEPPAPARPPHSTRTAYRRRDCRTRLQHSRRERSLMLTGPPPKFHGTRDILPRPSRCKQQVARTRPDHQPRTGPVRTRIRIVADEEGDGHGRPRRAGPHASPGSR